LPSAYVSFKEEMNTYMQHGVIDNHSSTGDILHEVIP
jgi:hypothetical protein